VIADPRGGATPRPRPAPTGTRPVVAIEGLAKRRERGGVAFELLVPELRIEPGELVAVVGESGCGKSTLLDLMALVLEPDAAETFRLVRSDGTEVDVAGLWQRGDERGLAWLRANELGYVLQAGGLLPFLDVRQNIALAARIKGVADGEAALRRLALRLGIADKLAVKPQYLSGGQRQRVAIARALVHGPGLVLADEPTAAVDGSRARQIVADLKRLAHEHGTTIVMVTHDRELVRPVADAVVSFALEAVSDTLTRSTCRRTGASAVA
jgi:putative ABC transport system ATP-binding protein